LESGNIAHDIGVAGFQSLPNPGWISKPGENLVIQVDSGGGAVVGAITAVCRLIDERGART
jgi:hypothetical protein